MSTELVALTGGVIGYTGQPVVWADLRFARGEVVALVGPNGSGKTTLVKGVLGLAELLGGDLRLFGMPAAQFRERYRLGYVPQGQAPAGPLTATVTEVVATGRLARRGRLHRFGATDRAAVAAALEAVSLTPQARRPVKELSGGQQRRMLVARALASDAEVLVLDEPLAGVDHASQQELADTLARLASGGTTIVVVLHELGPLGPLVTRVVGLAGGRVVFDGDPTEAGVEVEGSHDADPHGGQSVPTGLGFQR